MEPKPFRITVKTNLGHTFTVYTEKESDAHRLMIFLAIGGALTITLEEMAWDVTGERLVRIIRQMTGEF